MSLHGRQPQALGRKTFSDPVFTRQENWALLQGCLGAAAFAGMKPRGHASAKRTKPLHQYRETVAVFLEHCREFHSQSTTGLYMTHDRFGPDLPFFDKKMKVGLRSHNFELPCLKKEASGA